MRSITDERGILGGAAPARIRRDCARSPQARDAFDRGVTLLQGSSRLDAYAGWYRSSLPIYDGRPAVLPWRRWLLLLVEHEIAQAIADPDFALPYRNWSADRPDAAAALAQTVYDSPPWDTTSKGFRSRVEGLARPGGPDQPEFYLSLCNADRLWAAWQANNPARSYLPPQSAPAALFPHRRNDPIQSPLTVFAPTNGQLLNVTRIYGYDSLDL